MPKYPYRDLGINFDRKFRNDLNANFDDIEADIKELGAGAQQAIEAAHEAETQAIYAQEQGDYANEKGTYADEQGDYAKAQGDYAKAQGDYAKAQGDYAKSVADQNKTTWKTPVATYSAIATTYPNPQHGDTVMTLDDGKIYRYENGQWNFTQQYNSTALNNLANELSKQNKQSTVIGHGLNIINASQNSPLDIRIEGRTLINMSQNVLDATKYYVLADKKSKVKFADATTYTGVAKFQGKNEKPILIRVENFEGKVSGSTVENPHVIKVGARTSLDAPSSYTAEFTQTDYSKVNKLDSTFPATSTTINGAMGQNLISFNLIEAVERTLGKIPASDTAGKVAWLKANIAKLTCNWWGYGSSPTGNRATLNIFNFADGNIWSTMPVNHTNGSVTKLTFVNTTVTKTIGSDGFVHFLAYADPSDGVTASTIYTDYVELEIELLQNAQLWNPRFPLYEVDATTEYPNILTAWDETEVLRRYPMVESVQHVQNPYVIAEGENLLPPFTEWTLHPNAVVREPYKLELSATASHQYSKVSIKVLKNTDYTIKFDGNSSTGWRVYVSTKDGLPYNDTITSLNESTKTATFNSGNNDVLYIFVSNTVTGTFTFEKPILTIGSTAKPFVQRNPSMLFAEVKLGAIGDKKDILWKDGQDWKVTKWIEKDVVLDGSLGWSFNTDKTGHKVVKFTTSIPALTSTEIVLKYDGKKLKHISGSLDEADASNIDGFNGANPNTLFISISDIDSGWGENYTPTAQEIKAYFYGWRMCNGTYGIPYDGTGTKTWYPIGDTNLSRAVTTCPTSPAPTISEGKISYYKLSYVLSTPQTIVVTDKVEGDLVVNGATQVEVGSGFTYTEVDGKRTYTKLAQNSRYNVTANILSVIANYDTSLKSVVDSVVAKQSDIAATVSVNVRAIAELYKRVKALGG